MAGIETTTLADGTLTYAVPSSPASLPPVAGRDLLRVWEAAREAALAHASAPLRAFRFTHADGHTTTLALTDRDAACWASAADAAHSLGQSYGLSVCLRLLALIDLLGRARWLAGFATITSGGTRLDPALLRLAAEVALEDDARFDAAVFKASLTRLPPRARS